MLCRIPVDVNANKTELGITNKRIGSCSQWENSNISDQVYVIICYKWVYNFKGVTVAVGSLLVLFQLTIKAAISIFISLNGYFRKNDCTKKTLKRIRRTLGYIVFVIEAIILGFVVGYTTLYSIGRSYKTVARYLTEHGNQILLIFGIIATCLLLPIEEYIEEPTQPIVQENELSVIINGRYQTNYGSNEASV